jgi:hypothetical protein
MPTSLSERERAVLVALATTIRLQGRSDGWYRHGRGYSTVRQVANECGLSLSVTRSLLRRLHDEHQATVEVKRGCWSVYKGGEGVRLLREITGYDPEL